MKQYLQLLDHVLTHGVSKEDRTGTGTLAVFDYTMKFDMADGFPLVTTKKIHIKSIIYELLWFLRGDQDIEFLKDNGVTIWNEWADQNGWVGPIYGKQWRDWKGSPIQYGTDQIAELITNLKVNPNSRRHLVSAWNVKDLERMALPPCHFAFQCVVLNHRLHMKVFLRSLDIFLGAPFDIASYAFLLHMIAHQTNLTPGELVISSTDTHLYKNHVDQALLQLSREPLKLPTFEWTRPSVPASIDEYIFDDIGSSVHGYTYHPAISAPIAV